MFLVRKQRLIKLKIFGTCLRRVKILMMIRVNNKPSEIREQRKEWTQKTKTNSKVGEGLTRFYRSNSVLFNLSRSALRLKTIKMKTANIQKNHRKQMLLGRSLNNLSTIYGMNIVLRRKETSSVKWNWKKAITAKLKTTQ